MNLASTDLPNDECLQLWALRKNVLQQESEALSAESELSEPVTGPASDLVKSEPSKPGPSWGFQAEPGPAHHYEHFIDLSDNSVPRSLYSRLVFILGVQSWEHLADHNWIYLALHLLLGSVEGDLTVSPDRRGTFKSGCVYSSWTSRLKQVAHDVWVLVFPAASACLTRREKADITHHMITLLSKDYHIQQAEMRPNVIMALLAGIQACSSPMTLPPRLVKYLAKTFGAWHIATEMLECPLTYVREDEIVVRDTIYDSLAEEDVFYGLWRRRAQWRQSYVPAVLPSSM
ncbi:hypothetical protein VTO73DRAFT_10239 [Trametes versicolor]